MWGPFLTLLLSSVLFSVVCHFSSSSRNPRSASRRRRRRSPAMPPPLPDDLVEEVLLRFPPENPSGLVRAGLVCRRWCRLVSDPGFRRRFREFHRRPPVLGMFYNIYKEYEIDEVRFAPTCSFPLSDFLDRRLRVLDARHGRVLVQKGSVLAVWDPIKDEARELPFPQKYPDPWAAAVLCSAAAGACDHLDCHQGPFLVVFVCLTNDLSLLNGISFVYTYSSAAAAWSEPLVCPPNYFPGSWMGSALVGNALYFGNIVGNYTALKYDLESCRASLIQLPSPSVCRFTTTEDGRLVFVNKDDSKLYMCSRKSTHDVDTKWEERVIELKTVFPADAVADINLRVIGSGVGIIFMKTGDEVYSIDLKTFKVKKTHKGTIHSIVPYMSFYTPAWKGTCTGEGPSAGHSSA